MAENSENEAFGAPGARFIREVADVAFAGDDDGQMSAEQLEKLRADMERTYQEALQVYKVRFTELPAMQQLRVKWKARAIADDDPVLMILEVLSIADARSHIVLTQIMAIVQAFEQVTATHARQISQAVREIAAARKETAVYTENLAKAKASQDSLSRAISGYGQEVPELLETMAGVRRLCDTQSVRAKLELMGIGAGLVLLGLGLGYLVFR